MDDESSTLCSICKREIIVDGIELIDDITSICPFCNSLFHTQHLSKWLLTNGSCPNCRKEIHDPSTIKIVNRKRKISKICDIKFHLEQRRDKRSQCYMCGQIFDYPKVQFIPSMVQNPNIENKSIKIVDPNSIRQRGIQKTREDNISENQREFYTNLPDSTSSFLSINFFILSFYIVSTFPISFFFFIDIMQGEPLNIQTNYALYIGIIHFLLPLYSLFGLRSGTVKNPFYSTLLLSAILISLYIPFILFGLFSRWGNEDNLIWPSSIWTFPLIGFAIWIIFSIQLRKLFQNIQADKNYKNLQKSNIQYKKGFNAYLLIFSVFWVFLLFGLIIFLIYR